MPLDITPENEWNHPIILALKLAIWDNSIENIRLLSACINSEVQESSLEEISRIIRDSDININKAKDILYQCWMIDTIKSVNTTDTIINWVIEAYVKIILRHLEN
jgi:hypothetical protein